MALGSYNTAFFNRRSGIKTYDIGYSMFGNMAATMQTSALYTVYYQFQTPLSCEADLWWGYDETYELKAEFSADALPMIYVSSRLFYEAALGAMANPMLLEAYRLEALLAAQAKTVLMIYVRRDCGAALLASINSVQTREVVMSFPDLEIPPGGVLTIDSELFNAMLNGENIIDQYDGEWITFDRPLQGVDVESGTSGPISVSILYRERYL